MLIKFINEMKVIFWDARKIEFLSHNEFHENVDVTLHDDISLRPKALPWKEISIFEEEKQIDFIHFFDELVFVVLVYPCPSQ